MCFLPSSLFSPSVALMPFLTNRPRAPISAQCPWLLIVRRRVLCYQIQLHLFCWQASWKRTHIFIPENLIKPFLMFYPVKPLFLILRFTLNFNLWRAMQSVRQHIFCVSWHCSIFANFKIICAQSESLICHSYAHCGSNFAQLICCSFSITPKPAVSFRFNLHIRSLAINGTGQVSEHKNACFNALPPSVSHFNGTVYFSEINALTSCAFKH